MVGIGCMVVCLLFNWENKKFFCCGEGLGKGLRDVYLVVLLLLCLNLVVNFLMWLVVLMMCFLLV